MRTTTLRRAGTFALVLLAGALATALGVTLVYARGVPSLTSGLGLLLQLPIVTALALTTRLVLTRVGKLSPAAAGFVLGPGAAAELGRGVLLGGAALLLPSLTLWAAGLAPFTISSAPPSLGALSLGLASFVVNAALQQLWLQGLVLAAGRGDGPTMPAVALGACFFSLTHLDPSASALFLVNLALFGGVTSLLFFRRSPPSYAAAIGLHGGSNFAEVFLLGSPAGGPQSALGVLVWPSGGTLALGGEGGFYSGLAATVVLLTLGGGLLRAARRPWSGDTIQVSG